MLDFLQAYGVWGLFLGSFLAATVVPFSSDALYAGVLYAGWVGGSGLRNGSTFLVRNLSVSEDVSIVGAFGWHYSLGFPLLAMSLPLP